MNQTYKIKPEHQAADYLTGKQVTTIEQRNPTYHSGMSHIQAEEYRGEPNTKAVCGKVIDKEVTARVVTRTIDKVDCSECKETVTE